MSLKIAVLVGSLRAGSFNRRLADALVHLPEAAAHSFSFADIGALPLYDQDQDAADPIPSVTALRDLVRDADGVLFVTAEYNRSIPGALKNAIDHGSRPYGESVWKGRPAGVIGTSPGQIGTALAQQHLRGVLAYLDMPVLDQPEAYIQWKDGLVGEDHMIAEASRAFLAEWMAKFLTLVEQHRSVSSAQA